MSTAQRDLWPDDIKSDDVLTPEEIRNHQARQLTERTNGLLVGHVVKHDGEDRTVVSFEVEAPRIENRIRLFEIQHRPDFEYPVAIIRPRDDLPNYLQDRVYRPGLGQLAEDMKGKWVDNDWVASSPSTFAQKVKTLLARASVKSVVLSLLARVNRYDSTDTGQDDLQT